MTRSKFAPRTSILLIACSLLVASCAHDTYQERVNLIKNHAETFYDNLKTNRVESAIGFQVVIKCLSMILNQVRPLLVGIVGATRDEQAAGYEQD